jgi:hypothetical protein
MRSGQAVLFVISGGAVPASAVSNMNSFKLVGGKGARPPKIFVKEV